MFTNISWGSYFTLVIIFLAAYYLFIAFRFYRDDLLQLLSGKPTDRISFKATKSIKDDQNTHQVNLQEAFEKQDHFQIAQSLADEIQAYLNEAGKDPLIKEDITQALKLLIAKYPSIKNSAFHEVIQNLIITACETNCSIHLSEDELSGLW